MLISSLVGLFDFFWVKGNFSFKVPFETEKRKNTWKFKKFFLMMFSWWEFFFLSAAPKWNDISLYVCSGGSFERSRWTSQSVPFFLQGNIFFFQVEVGKTISIHFHPYLCLKSRVSIKSREIEGAVLFHGAPYKFTHCFISSPVTSCSHRWGLVTLLMSCANWISSCVHTGMHLILKSLQNQSFWPLDSR